LKVLTVWQPWASLIAIGAKPFGGMVKLLAQCNVRRELMVAAE
jgi:hypothetical protein